MVVLLQFKGSLSLSSIFSVALYLVEKKNPHIWEPLRRWLWVFAVVHWREIVLHMNSFVPVNFNLVRSVLRFDSHAFSMAKVMRIDLQHSWCPFIHLHDWVAKLSKMGPLIGKRVLLWWLHLGGGLNLLKSTLTM